MTDVQPHLNGPEKAVYCFTFNQMAGLRRLFMATVVPAANKLWSLTTVTLKTFKHNICSSKKVKFFLCFESYVFFRFVSLPMIRSQKAFVWAWS